MIYLTGDICLTDGYFDVGFGVGSKLAKGFDPFVHLNREDADLWIGNFEGVASDFTNKKGTSALQFRVNPECLNHLRHFDVYGFANNHAMQHGGKAYMQTVEVLEGQGAKCFAMNCKRSLIFNHQGRTISLTGLSQRIDPWGEQTEYWHNPEFVDVEKELCSLPEDAYKIIYVHWGNEFINYPSSSQKKFAHWLVDKGFDLVVGMHPHILQGYEKYNGKYIFYSIGNFVFDMAWEPTHYGAIVDVDFTKDEITIGTEYVRIGEDFAPQVVDEKDVPKAYRFEKLNELLTIEENSEEYHANINKYYKKYRKANHIDIAKKMAKNPSAVSGIIKDFIKRRL